ncbi:guanylate-binding protein 4-like [Neopelma chrysocephalum]|uniref:guanylate-binding protein 4-like n=1 Tax=Neopelma chrysocephalum TaxID=114329 RepID=UPI000FCCE586|nr:guanylate-binding protein 4-like [Neopelma chrysocephalum]
MWPICLVENSREKGLVVQPKALQVLLGLKQPVVVKADTQFYSEGKSYLRSRLRTPHPHLSDHTLITLYPEDQLVCEGDPKNSRWLLVLTLLLSSSLIHTSYGGIDQWDMDRLRYRGGCGTPLGGSLTRRFLTWPRWLSKLPQLIRYKESPGGGADLQDSHRFALFFPNFIWEVEDCAQELEGKDGHGISDDEYLERALRLQPGTNPKAQQHNLTRECIRQFFPGRRCFKFLEEPEEEFEFPWEEMPRKTLPGGLVVTGELLGRLAEIYVGQIRAGAVPCLERAVRDLAPVANAAAVKAAVGLYRERMERLELPTDTATEMLQLHGRCEREALELFMERAFPDGICNGQAQFMRQVEALKAKFFSENERVSRARCEEVLRELSQDMETRIRDRSWGVVRDYHQALVEQYWKMPGKGLKAAAVLQEFLRSRTVPRSILSMDRSPRTWSEWYLRELERRVRAEKADEEQQRRQEQLRRRSEHQRQLKEKLEGFEMRQHKEHRRLIVHKAKEGRALHQEGFHEQADLLLSTVMDLEREYGKSGRNGSGGDWNGGNSSGNGGNSGWNSNSNASRTWIHVLLAVLAVLAFIILRI